MHKHPPIGERLFDKKTIVVACDVTTLREFNTLVESTCDIPGIGGYKVGFSLGLQGLPDVVDLIGDYNSEAMIIYDHQKAGTDIPDTGKQFAEIMQLSGVDAAILFPLAGRATEMAWIEALFDAEIIPIVGGEMTHEAFFQKEGGFIADEAPLHIYAAAIEAGVVNFVLPGNKTESVKKYIEFFDQVIGPGRYTSMAPGLITQGGEISEFAELAGDHWAAIVGRGIYAAPDIRESAIEIVSALGLLR